MPVAIFVAFYKFILQFLITRYRLIGIAVSARTRVEDLSIKLFYDILRISALTIDTCIAFYNASFCKQTEIIAAFVVLLFKQNVNSAITIFN